MLCEAARGVVADSLLTAGFLPSLWNIHSATGRPAQYLDPASHWLADPPCPRTHKFSPAAAAAIVAGSTQANRSRPLLLTCM
jgi:hypothetical protein